MCTVSGKFGEPLVKKNFLLALTKTIIWSIMFLLRILAHDDRGIPAYPTRVKQLTLTLRICWFIGSSSFSCFACYETQGDSCSETREFKCRQKMTE